VPSLTRFIATRRQHWERLEQLLARSGGNGLRTLSAGEIEDLGRAYRQLVSDLALAQRDFPHDQLTASLNALATRAHLQLYRAPPRTWRRLLAFLTTGFARRLWQARLALALAATLTFLPAAWAYVGALHDDGIRQMLVAPQLRETMERGRTWTEIAGPLRPAMATVIFTNNIRVAFAAFSGGILAGLGTAYILVLNGLHLGAILGAAHHYGVARLLWDFISPHAYLELTCIVIAGAAGLQLGHAILRPGLLRRREALSQAARQAAELILGTTPVFVCAGLVEGFISPSSLPTTVKLVLGPLLWVGWVAWLLFISLTPHPPSPSGREGRAP
jgi:uncharacterized membrane protein SpoIIM required for sporulation